MLYTEKEIEEQFDEFLDDAYPVVTIGSSTFYPSQILKECDPIAYRIGVSEYEDILAEDMLDED
jgi:hypothetical protein